MKRCDCCEAVVADNSLRLICPPCAQSLIVANNRAHMACRLHGRTIDWGEWDNVESPSKLSVIK